MIIVKKFKVILCATRYWQKEIFYNISRWLNLRK